jgi:hypothetical protein
VAREARLCGECSHGRGGAGNLSLALVPRATTRLSSVALLSVGMCWRERAASTRLNSSRARRGLGGAPGPSGPQNQPDAEAVRRVVRPLPALRQRPDGGDPPADQRQVERRDHHSANEPPGGLATARQGGGQHRCPAHRDREVNGRGGDQQHRCTPLMRQQHGAGGAAAVKDVVASHQRPHRGRDRRTRRPSQTGCQGVARNCSGAPAAHASIVAGPGPLIPFDLDAAKRVVHRSVMAGRLGRGRANAGAPKA